MNNGLRLAILTLLAMPACVPASAGGRVTEWISQEGGVGLVLEDRGGRLGGELYLLTEDGAHLAERISVGLYDREEEALLLPLKVVTLVQVGSVKKLREGGSPYVEVRREDISETRALGRWRRGKEPPLFAREFVPYDRNDR